MSQSVSVDVQVVSSVTGLPDDEMFESWVTTVLEAKAKENPVEVCVRIVDEAEGRELNNAYRAIDKATNVLSFPSGIEEGMPVDAPEPLGDIVICAPVVEREAAEQGKKLTDHWAHLVVHGTLHLLGYDHESDDDAEIMESIEREILAAGGVTDPYAA